MENILNSGIMIGRTTGKPYIASNHNGTSDALFLLNVPDTYRKKVTLPNGSVAKCQSYSSFKMKAFLDSDALKQVYTNMKPNTPVVVRYHQESYYSKKHQCFMQINSVDNLQLLSKALQFKSQAKKQPKKQKPAYKYVHNSWNPFMSGYVKRNQQ